MVLLALAAIAGGLKTSVALTSNGILIYLLGAPIGGSLCTMLAALFIVWRRELDWQNDSDPGAPVDVLVGELRELPARGIGLTGYDPEEAEPAAQMQVHYSYKGIYSSRGADERAQEVGPCQHY